LEIDRGVIMNKVFIGILFSTVVAMAQPAPTPAPPGEVIGVGNFIHLVSDADKSVDYYHDVIGMDLQRPPGAAANAPVVVPRPFIATPEIVSLYNAAGAQYRATTTLVPDSPMRAELVEWKGIDRKTVQPRIQDPGAATLILTVRNIDEVMARVKKSGSPVVTMGGEPVNLGDDRAVLLRDPDGFYVELIQPKDVPAATPAGNLIDVSFAFTVSDTERMMRVFRDALGFQPRTGGFLADRAHTNLTGTPGAQYRVTTALVPGTTFPIQFWEFKSIDRRPVESRTQDPGSPVLRLRVRDMESVLKALSGAGVTVASRDGKYVTLAGAAASQRFAITKAPDNLFIQVVQALPNAPQAQAVPPAVPPAGPRLMSHEELAARPQTVGAKGDQLRHYFFTEAAREVPYRVYVPSRYDGRTALPMMVALHGAGGTHDTLMDWGKGMIKDLAEKHGYIVVTPLAYPLGSSYGQHFNIGIPDSARAGSGMSDLQRKQSDEWSEKDVLNVTELVAKEYHVDRARIYLMGHSRGALATWYLGEKYRDKWAGLAPVAGGFLNLADYPFEHLKGLPIIVSQGSADAVALPERARNQVAALEKAGQHPVYVEVAGATHGSIVDAALAGIFDFFDAHSRK
jgi:poly(3-hydroxybutyrate) depolymerase/catechol 2,3-dioxygenase-like lactoylglutathione lyase family enzyme